MPEKRTDHEGMAAHHPLRVTRRHNLRSARRGAGQARAIAARVIHSKAKGRTHRSATHHTRQPSKRYHRVTASWHVVSCHRSFLVPVFTVVRRREILRTCVIPCNNGIMRAVESVSPPFVAGGRSSG